MAHKAEIVKGSIEHLGANGLAFSIMCCGDEKTIERHTICHAHTMTTVELETMIERQYLNPCAQAHAASEAHYQHFVNLTAGDVTDCENCK